MQYDPASTPDEEERSDPRYAPEDSDFHKIVRLFKTIVVNPEEGKYVDGNVVSFEYYNAFNYSLLAKVHENVHMTIGITSANPGEGKTLVASNLGASLAMGYRRETVLVDLNIQRPRLHEVFGTVYSPGLVESFSNGSIHISRTKIDHLYVLSAGNVRRNPIWLEGSMRTADTETQESSLGLEQMAAFRDVVYSLEQEFEFVIVDMPSIHSRNFPILFSNQLNGLLMVVQSGRTKRTDLERVFRRVNERQVLGFVLNHVGDEV
jgi:Mrp family chromosome partitioning ATPase